MLRDRFFVPSSDKYLSDDIICYDYFSDSISSLIDLLVIFFFWNSWNNTAFHSSFLYFDHNYIEQLMELNKLLYCFDKFSVDFYLLYSSVFSQKS